MEKRLLGYMKNFELVDFYGFANIVGAKETEEFEDFVTEIIIKFMELPRKDRKNLLKIAKDIAGNNLEYNELKAQGEIKTRGLRRKLNLLDDAASISEGME